MSNVKAIVEAYERGRRAVIKVAEEREKMLAAQHVLQTADSSIRSGMEINKKLTAYYEEAIVAEFADPLDAAAALARVRERVQKRKDDDTKRMIGGDIDQILRAVDLLGFDDETKAQLHKLGTEAKEDPFGVADLDADAKPVQDDGLTPVQRRVRRHTRRVADAVSNGHDPKTVLTDDPTGEKAAVLG